MSREYLSNPNQNPNPNMNMNPNMNSQPPKRDSKIIIILLSLILVLVLAAITAFVLIAIKSKDENKENPSDSQSVVVTEQTNPHKTGGLPQAGGDLPSIGSSSASSDAQNTATAAPNAQQTQADSQGNPQPNPAPNTNSGETVTPGNGPQKPADGVETLEYFNTVINRVKTGASSVEQKKVENYLANAPTIPSALNGVYKMLGGDSWLDQMLKDNSQGAATYRGADIRAKFPVEGESYASKLTASDVRSATCTESNGIYTITITTLPDAKSTAHKHGTGHNPKAFNVILPATVNENIPGAAKGIVGEAAMVYPSSTVTITVDAATGNVLTANYDLKWTISFTKMDADIPLGTRSEYVIKW